MPGQKRPRKAMVKWSEDEKDYLRAERAKDPPTPHGEIAAHLVDRSDLAVRLKYHKMMEADRIKAQEEAQRQEEGYGDAENDQDVQNEEPAPKRRRKSKPTPTVRTEPRAIVPSPERHSSRSSQETEVAQTLCAMSGNAQATYMGPTPGAGTITPPQPGADSRHASPPGDKDAHPQTAIGVPPTETYAGLFQMYPAHAQMAAPQHQMVAPHTQMVVPQAQMVAPRPQMAAPHSYIEAPQTQVAVPQARTVASQSQMYCEHGSPRSNHDTAEHARPICRSVYAPYAAGAAPTTPDQGRMSVEYMVNPDYYPSNTYPSNNYPSNE